jgi:hypothetical protein
MSFDGQPPSSADAEEIEGAKSLTEVAIKALGLSGRPARQSVR